MILLPIERISAIDRTRRITLSGLFAFFCSLLLLTVVLIWSDATRKVDRLLHDSWVRFHQRDVPSDIVIAAIDTKSLAALGRWPWSRPLQSELYSRLAELGARILIVDVLYTEDSETRAEDDALGRSIGMSALSVLPVLAERVAGNSAAETLPVPAITREVSNFGHVVLPIDDDGIVRRVFLKAGFDTSHWQSLSLAALESLGELPEILPGVASQQTPKDGQLVQDKEVYIPFYGGNGTFSRLSAVDIIRGNVEREQLEGRVVFVGLTTTGLGDVVPTPVSALNQPVPGVEIHANIFASLRDGSMITRLPSYIAFPVACLLLPLMLLAYSKTPPEWGLISSLVGSAVPVIASGLLYFHAHLWFAPLAASVPVLISYLLWSRHRLQYVNLFLEEEQKRSQKHMPEPVADNNAALENFFTNASAHLPIEGWSFSRKKQQFFGGRSLPMIVPAPQGVDDRWIRQNNVLIRRYPKASNMLVQMQISDESIGTELSEYIDSMARAMVREQSNLLSGSIERLQSNVLSMSSQLDWLRSVMVFSETVLSAAPMGFVVWNLAGECIRANSLLYQQVEGFARRGTLLEFIKCVSGVESAEDVEKKLYELIIDKDNLQISVREEDRELIVNIRAVGDKLAERLICASVIDVTDIRTAEKARAEMVDYLSHDLRSPLVSAMYLLEPGADPGIARNIEQSLSMMDDLLHIARADNLSEQKFKPLLLNAILDSSLDQLYPQARERHIVFEVQVTDEIDLWVIGDAASLERSITNIIGNAIKYSSINTVVKVSLLEQDGWAVLTVDDQGVGIDPAMLQHLFARFKRDEKSASQHKGIGLGLALVARVVGLHGGRVEARNLEVGTRIVLELPLEEDQEAAGIYDAQATQ